MMRRSMQILDPHNTSIQLSRLSFNNVYYGSVVSRKVILHNNSPICSDYICAVDENMSDMNHSLVTCTQKSKDTYAAFQFPPEQVFDNCPTFNCVCVYLIYCLVAVFLLL